MVRIGLVGSGFMAETHLAGYEEVADAEIVAVASPNTADEFVAEQGLDAETYASCEQLLDGADVDAIDVCTPTPTHREFVAAAADRGVDVFCEKPIATNLEDANAIRETVDDAGVSLMIGHVLRFFPQYERVRETVEDGGVGTPGVARARRLSPFPEWGHGDWYANREQSGGVLLDLSIHDFDYLRWVLGDVDRVFARRSVFDGREQAHATLRFESGAVGYVEGSWALPDSQELTSSLEVAGDGGLVELDSDDSTPYLLATDEEASTASSLDVAGYAAQLSEFVDSLREEREPAVTADDAIEALRVSLAAVESAERGEPVAVEEVTA